MTPNIQELSFQDYILDEDENWNDDITEESEYDDLYSELPFESSYEF